MCLVLDLTAVFNIVDHSFLLARLQHYLGICGSTLEWFRSYLADRTSHVSLGYSESGAASL